jgi:hypothetical protein
MRLDCDITDPGIFRQFHCYGRGSLPFMKSAVQDLAHSCYMWNVLLQCFSNTELQLLAAKPVK